MSNFINKSDFFAAITGQPVEWDCPDVGLISVRSLTMVEAGQLRTKVKDDYEALLGAVMLGMVNPKLDEADLDLLQQAKPGAVSAIGQKILVLSGMKQDEDLEKKAGNGS